MKYTFGAHGNGGSMSTNTLPNKVASIWSEAGKLKSVLLNNWNNAWLVGENYTVTDGICMDTGLCNGRGETVDRSPEILPTSEKIISAVFDGSFICLGESGKLYGAGLADYLGENSNETKVSYNGVLHELKSDEKFVQIVGGNHFAVAVTSDGRVFGTGSNQNGVLGRWSGAPRTAGRYRTAYDWVECPELEL